MKTIAIIPARGGSKGIPRKNLTVLAGRPLIAYAIDAARKAHGVDRVIVSTDDEEITTVAKTWGAEVPFLRPPELANDEAPMLGVVRHALDWYEKNEGSLDALVLLQPTSPLRTAHHIDEAIKLFFANGTTSVVSVMEVPHQFSPSSVMTLENGILRAFAEGGTKATRRQDKPRVYARNGPAIVVSGVSTIKSGDLYGEKSLPYIMHPHDSIDIDTMADLEYAAWLMGRADAAAR